MAKQNYLSDESLRSRYDFLRAMCSDFEGPVGKQVLFAQGGIAPEFIERQLASLERKGLVKHTRVSPDEDNYGSRTAFYPTNIDQEYPQKKSNGISIDSNDLASFHRAAVAQANQTQDGKVSPRNLTLAFSRAGISSLDKQYFLALVKADMQSGNLVKRDGGYYPR